MYTKRNNSCPLIGTTRRTRVSERNMKMLSFQKGIKKKASAIPSEKEEQKMKVSFLWKKEQRKPKVLFLWKRNNKNESAVPSKKKEQQKNKSIVPSEKEQLNESVAPLEKGIAKTKVLFLQKRTSK